MTIADQLKRSFIQDPTSEQSNLIDSLRGQTVDCAQRICATAIWDRVLRNWKRKHRVRETSGQRHWKRLAGKRPEPIECTGGSCLPGSDHDRLWIRDGKPVCITMEPYALYGEKLCSLIEICKEHGFFLAITSGSWHFPNGTIRVEVWKNEVEYSRCWDFERSRQDGVSQLDDN